MIFSGIISFNLFSFLPFLVKKGIYCNLNMKIRIKTLIASSITAALTVLLGTACSPSDGGTDGKAQVVRAFPDTADVAMYFDQRAMSDSAIGEKIQDMQEDVEGMEASEELSEQFMEITGLDDDDITDFALAVSGLENAQIDPSLIRISGAIFAEKAVTAEQVVEAINFIAEQNGETVELTVTVGEGADFIEFQKEEGVPEMYAAIMTGDDSTTAFFGDKASVEEAMDRPIGSISASLMAPSKGLIDGQQGWISFIIPESLKGQLAGIAAQGDQMAPGLSKIQSLQSVGIGMKATDNLTMAVGFNLGSAEDAQAIEVELISLAKMMLAGSTPEPLPLLQSLAAGQSGERATLSLSVSMKDMEILQAQLLNFLPGAGMVTPQGITPSAQ